MEIIYKSIDGEFFKSEQDCKDHEERICFPSGAIYYYDGIVHKPESFTEEKKMIEQSEYVYITKINFPRFSKMMYENGFEHPSTPGLWRWDNDYSEWVDIENDISDQIAVITRASAELNKIEAVKLALLLKRGE